MPYNPPAKFLTENPNNRLCAICGEKKKLSFEHLPPKATGNNNYVKIYGIESFTCFGGYFHGRHVREKHNGMGGYTLCKECNNLMGSWYCNSYIELSNQLNEILNENLGKRDVEFTIQIKALNFLKQVVCMLLSADQPTGTLRNRINAKEFLLNKHSKELPDNLFINAVVTTIKHYVIHGFYIGYNSIMGHSQNIEFAHQPLYLRCAFEEKYAIKEEVNIVEFKQFDYNEKVALTYKLPLKQRKLHEFEGIDFTDFFKGLPQ